MHPSPEPPRCGPRIPDPLYRSPATCVVPCLAVMQPSPQLGFPFPFSAQHANAVRSPVTNPLEPSQPSFPQGRKKEAGGGLAAVVSKVAKPPALKPKA
jgi:hypothetical protein